MNKKSDKLARIRDTLPESKRVVFDSLVADYKYAAAKLIGVPIVSYVVLAELVKLGWTNEAIQ